MDRGLVVVVEVVMIMIVSLPNMNADSGGIAGLSGDPGQKCLG